MSDYTPPTLVIPTPGGNPGDGTLKGALIISPNSNSPISHGSSAEIYTDNGGTLYLDGGIGRGVYIGYGVNGNQTVLIGGSVQMQATFAEINGINTEGLGLSPLYGKDVRTGLTAVDSAAKTLYTTTSAGQLYRLMGRILATAGTSPSATYTIKWTEGGATITKTLTISALDSDSDLSILIQPDNATAITAQLTAISGTGTTVNVAATVEQMA